jgi:diacylglycerol kinase (ATP)
MSQRDNQRHVKLIANPGAGNASDATKNLEMVTSTLQEYGLRVDVALAKPKKEAIPIARKAVKEGYKTVIAMGGDGTIEAVMRGVLDITAGRGSKTHFGILPTGTANNIAKSIGIPVDLKEACALIAKDQIRKLDVGLASTKKFKTFYFFELTAIGLTAALYPEAKEIPKGKLSSIKDVISTLVKQETNPKVILKMDGESIIEEETLLVTVSNTPVFGLNLLVAPNASLQDGLLDISLYPSFNKADLLAYYAKVMNEGTSQDGNIQRYRAHKLKIKTSPKLYVMADGIMLGKGTVRIKVCPGALRVIVPEQEVGLAAPQNEADGEEAIPVPLAVSVEMAQ